MQISVLNIDPASTQEDLRTLFMPFGEVSSVDLALDLFTGKPRGWATVEMPSEEEADKAILALNHTDFKGKKIEVKKASLPQSHKGSYKVGSGNFTAYRFKRNGSRS